MLRAVDSPPSDQARWFAQEVQPHDAALRGYLRATFPWMHDVDDVVQESYLRIWKARASRPVQSARAFLFAVARHFALDLLRRHRRSPVAAVGDLAALNVVDDRPGVVATVGTAEKIRLLAAAVATLPPRCREVVMLCKIEGLSHREAAARLGLAEKTVDEHLLRGLRRLGAALRAQGIDRYFEP
jgi:RNA polymerase sigma-70 factor (ECF subfamily)